MKPASRLLDDYVEHVFRESQQAKDASAAAKHSPTHEAQGIPQEAGQIRIDRSRDGHRD